MKFRSIDGIKSFSLQGLMLNFSIGAGIFFLVYLVVAFIVGHGIFS